MVEISPGWCEKIREGPPTMIRMNCKRISRLYTITGRLL